MERPQFIRLGNHFVNLLTISHIEVDATGCVDIHFVGPTDHQTVRVEHGAAPKLLSFFANPEMMKDLRP